MLEGVASPRLDATRVYSGGHIGDQDALLFQGALAHDPFAERDVLRLAGALGVAGEELKRTARRSLAFRHLVNGALLRLHQRHQIGQQRLGDGEEIALPLEHAGEARDVGLQPILLAIALRRLAQVRDHRVEVVLQLGDFAFGIHLDGAGQIALGHGGGHLGNGAHLRGQIRGEEVHIAGQILPHAGGAGDVRLSAQPPIHAHLARDVGHLVGKRRERVRHVIDRLGERRDFAFRLHGELLAQVAIRHRGHDFHDAADLIGQIRGHEVHVVRQILPGAAHAGNLRLAAELAFGADFARHASHFGREGVELIDHRIDGVLQLQNFALHIDGDLAAQIAARHRGGHFRDVAHLGGEVRAHGIDGIRKILPRAGHSGHHRLHAEPPFRADFARHAGDFRREGAKLLHHGIDRFLELQNFAAHIHGDFLGKIAIGDRDGHLGDVAHLAGEVRGHGVDVIRQIFPGARPRRAPAPGRRACPRCRLRAPRG